MIAAMKMLAGSLFQTRAANENFRNKTSSPKSLEIAPIPEQSDRPSRPSAPISRIDNHSYCWDVMKSLYDE